MMKKILSLLFALILCFTLAACSSGSTGNDDYDYLISLLDRGEYDMAIQLIEMLRSGSSEVPAAAQPAEPQVQTGSQEAPESPCLIPGPGEIFYDAQAVLENGTDYHFHMELVNNTDRQLTLADCVILDYENGNATREFAHSGDEYQGQDWHTLEPGKASGYDDWHPCPAPFDRREYRLIYEDADRNGYTVTFVFDLQEAREAETASPNSTAPSVDYSQDPGMDLATLRYDADYEVEVSPGIYWVPARALGASRYTNADIFRLVQDSPEHKRDAISTLYEALQLYQVGGFLSADDNLRIIENGIDWEHHKPGYYAVLTNCGCCATDSNWLHYILDGDYDEIGYLATSQRDGSGHVFNYILQDGWYYLIDLTHYRAEADWISTAVEDGSMDRYYNSDFILGNIHKTTSLEAYADYIQAEFNDPPGLIVKYTATEVPAVTSLWNQDGSVEILYARMNELDLQIIFDDPDDSLTFRFETAPSQVPDWS